MTLISFDDFKKLPEYNKFIQENPAIGNLKVEAFTAYRAIPVSEVNIIVSKDIGNYKVVFFNGFTDSSGMISKIELPAPAAVSSSQKPEYTVYDLAAIHEGYETIKRYGIGMFGGVNVIQYVKMNPEVILEGDMQNGS